MFVAALLLVVKNWISWKYLNAINGRSDSYITVYSYKGILYSNYNDESQLCVCTMINLNNNEEKLIAGYVECDTI